MDINRLARFAMCRNALTVLKYLVDEGKVNLNAQDTKRRSAIVYALWDHPDWQMFEYLRLKISLDPDFVNDESREELGIALNYAIDFGRLDAIEFLLELDVPYMEFKVLWQPWGINALLVFKYLLTKVPDPTIQVVITGPPGVCNGVFYPSLRRLPSAVADERFNTDVDETAKDRSTVWVHLPWANVINDRDIT